MSWSWWVLQQVQWAFLLLALHNCFHQKHIYCFSKTKREQLPLVLTRSLCKQRRSPRTQTLRGLWMRDNARSAPGGKCSGSKKPPDLNRTEHSDEEPCRCLAEVCVEVCVSSPPCSPTFVYGQFYPKSSQEIPYKVCDNDILFVPILVTGCKVSGNPG